MGNRLRAVRQNIIGHISPQLLPRFVVEGKMDAAVNPAQPVVHLNLRQRSDCSRQFSRRRRVNGQRVVVAKDGPEHFDAYHRAAVATGIIGMVWGDNSRLPRSVVVSNDTIGICIQSRDGPPKEISIFGLPFGNAAVRRRNVKLGE